MISEKRKNEIDKELRALKPDSDWHKTILSIYDAIDRKDEIDYKDCLDYVHYYDESSNISSYEMKLVKERFLCLNV